MSTSRSRKVCVAVGMLTGVMLMLTGNAMGAGDANMSRCPQQTEESPGFRTYLPDCRAYELVSPPSTGGFGVNGGQLNNSTLAPVAASGDGVVGLSLGSFAGAEYSYVKGSSLGSPYFFGRSDEGWNPASLMPKPSQMPSPLVRDFGSELAQSLWQTGENVSFGEPTVQHFYLRNPLGQFAEIGPATPIIQPLSVQGNLTYLGASADLARMAYLLQRESPNEPNPYWPGDNTVSGGAGAFTASLYEYSGTGVGEPSLVGVRNSESIGEAGVRFGKAHINEAANQISTCGIEPGSGYGQDLYNAISPSGFGVFFTAKAGPCAEGGLGPVVNELYVRVGGTHTLALSEPPLTVPGRGCTEVCAESQNEENGHQRASASFAGASENGESVYFITSQPMVNADRDQSPDLYMEEVTATGVTRIVDVSRGGGGDPSPGEGASVLGVSRVAADGSRVYFVAEGVLATSSNANGERAQASGKNLYVYDAGTQDVNFVAQLAEGDEFRLWGPEDTHFAQASAQDGRFLAFITKAHPEGTGDSSGNGGNVGQVFLYDALSGELKRVSVGEAGQFVCPLTGLVESGYNCNGNVQVNSQAPKIRVQEYAHADLAYFPNSAINVTPEGTVFFESTAALTEGARSGAPNFEPGLPSVYEYRDGNVFLISDGVEAPATAGGAKVEAATAFVSATADGGALFLTADPLVPQDSNTSVSMYDAHANGGYPASSSPVACTGQSCRSGESSGAGEAYVGSKTPEESGNVKQKPHKKPHKKRHKKHKKHKKRQKNDVKKHEVANGHGGGRNR